MRLVELPPSVSANGFSSGIFKGPSFQSMLDILSNLLYSDFLQYIGHSCGEACWPCDPATPSVDSDSKRVLLQKSTEVVVCDAPGTWMIVGFEVFQRRLWGHLQNIGQYGTSFRVIGFEQLVGIYRCLYKSRAATFYCPGDSCVVLAPTLIHNYDLESENQPYICSTKWNHFVLD